MKIKRNKKGLAIQEELLNTQLLTLFRKRTTAKRGDDFSKVSKLNGQIRQVRENKSALRERLVN
jgi:hypothetical protein